MKTTIATGSLVLLLSMAGSLRTSRAAETWRTVDQPQLSQALEHAPLLQIESLGEPSRGVTVFSWDHMLVPNPDGKTWDYLLWYYKWYGGPTWLYAVDLGTGQVKRQRYPDNHQVYLSGQALAFDGKYYMATHKGYSAKEQGMAMFVYDPATNTLEDRGVILPELSGEVRPMALGPDGNIYGTGSRKGGKVGLYVYSPTERKVVKDFGPVGPAHHGGVWAHAIGVDDTHAYILSGNLPMYIVAVNLQTGEEKVLLETPHIRDSQGHFRLDVLDRFPGAIACVPQEGAQGHEPSLKQYWLYHGQMILKENDTPPWPAKPSPWDKKSKKPEVYYGQLEPDAEGKATFWHRTAEDAAKAPKHPAENIKPEALGWKAIQLEGVETYPQAIHRMGKLPDGRLYGIAGDYVGAFIYDPHGDKATELGRLPLSTYTLIACGDKLYMGGYSGGPIFLFNPKLPWTHYKGGPPGHAAPGQNDPTSNPRHVGSLATATRIAIARASALGADGRVYFGGEGHRNYGGGGFGWYDPKNKKMDGFWKPLSGYQVRFMAPSQEGRLIVLSTSAYADEQNDNRKPDQAKLFVYDVVQAKIVREIAPVPKAPTTGLILDVTPDRLLGLTVDPAAPFASSILYGLDVATGKVLFTRTLPWPIADDEGGEPWYTGWGWVGGVEQTGCARGPDGCMWTYLRDVLVRIDPKDASVHVIGKITSRGIPTFVGNDAYLSGTEQLRRIRNIVAAR